MLILHIYEDILLSKLVLIHCFLKAFIQAWKAFCGANQGNPTLMVPAGHSFFVHQTIFKGPCKSQNLHIQVKNLFSIVYLNSSHTHTKKYILD
jgi:hypothetical protein